MTNNRDKVIVALDLNSASDAVALASRLGGIFPFFKIGSKLFTQAGPALVRDVLAYGKVFLDLKFHDIPSVVAAAVEQAASLGVSLLTIHASGGSEMITMCAEKTRSLQHPPKILAVTVLTSLNSLEEFGISRIVFQQVEALSELARVSGADGIVCSPAELMMLRSRFTPPFLLVTPGIRGAGDAKGDQKRTASPREALSAGADYLVIGRPIIEAEDPLAAASRIAETLI